MGDIKRENIKRLLWAHGYTIKSILLEQGIDLGSKAVCKEAEVKFCKLVGVKWEDLEKYPDICKYYYGECNFSKNLALLTYLKSIENGDGERLTRQKIANDFGVSRARYIEYMSKGRHPYGSTLIDLAAYFGITPIQLTYGNPEIFFKVGRENELREDSDS